MRSANPSSPPQAPALRPEEAAAPFRKPIPIAVLCFFAQVIAYCDRVNISVAAPLISAEHGWDAVQMGWILSGFFAGYMLFMIPAGLAVDRFGPKRMLTAGIAWWSFFTFLTPLFSSARPMTGARVLVGMGESGTIPSINAMLARWFPPTEYSRVAGFCWSGGYAGAIIAFPLASALAGAWGWRAMFYAFAGLGALWLPFWLWLANDRGPYLAPHEARPKVPWNKLLKERAVWSLFGLHLSSNWFVYVLVSWLPTYLLTVRGFSLQNAGWTSALPFLCALLATNLFASVIDRLTPGRDRASVRKRFLLVSLSANLILPFIPYIGDAGLIIVMFCAAMALHAAGTPVQASNSLDLTSRYAGPLVGVQNCFANIAGIVAPVTTGYLVRSVGWESVFLTTALISSLGIAGFLLFGKAERIAD